jgi:GAF domain-containing protein
VATRSSGTSSPFDRSLETRALIAAAEEYALRRGPRQTPAYRAAWLEFRHRIRTIEDLGRWRHARGEMNADAVRILNAAIERAMLIDEARMANAQLLDPDGQALRIVAHSGFTTRFLEFFEIVDHTSSACGSALATGRAVWVADTTQSPIFADTPALDVMLDADIRAVASVPITSPDGRLTGMISTHHTRPTSWTPRRKVRLQGIARSAGRILDHLAPASQGESAGKRTRAG